MTIIKAKDYNDMSRKAANFLSAQVIMNPDCVLGLATGSTPIGIYKQLVEWYKKGDLDFSRVKTVNLDEYKGLAPTDPQSYRYYMDYHLFDHINIDKDNTYLPDGLARDPEEECRNYNSILQILGGVDLQLLGLGHNGHIGFNEPDSSFGKETHLVQLTKRTIRANSRLFQAFREFPGRPGDRPAAPRFPSRASGWCPPSARRKSGDCHAARKEYALCPMVFSRTRAAPRKAMQDRHKERTDIFVS